MNDNDIYSYDINGNFYGVSDGYYSELYSEIGKFIVDNIDENIDINKDYKYITINNDYDKNIVSLSVYLPDFCLSPYPLR